MRCSPHPWIASFIVLSALGPARAQAPDPGAGRPDWTVTAGALGLAGPAVPGADQRRNLVFPLLEAEYRRRWSLGRAPGGAGLGVGLHGPRGSWGGLELGLGFSLPRPEHRAEVLAGMGDRSGALWLGAAVRRRLGPLTASLDLARGLTAGAGTRLGLDLGRGFQLAPRWLLLANAGAELADAANLAFEFGISPDQAGRRQALVAAGDPRLRPGEAAAFAPGAGLRELQARTTLVFTPAARWHFLGLLQEVRLAGQAARSPLVRRSDNLTFGLGFSHEF